MTIKCLVSNRGILVFFFGGGLGSANFIFMGARILLTLLSAAFCTDAILHVNRLTLTFARHFPAFEHLRSMHSLASFLCFFLLTPTLRKIWSYTNDAATLRQKMLCRNAALNPPSRDFQ